MPKEDADPMAITRFAEVAWSGDLLTGSGSINYVSSGAFTRLPVTWASRTEAHDGRTSPEELVASAHASCFSMAFSAGLARNGTPATTLTVKSVVTFDKTDAGWKITKSELTVAGVVANLDQEKFAELADAAKDGCPISSALKGNVELSVVATLAG
jgi:osmotically inducible protein OsmC